MTRLRAAGIAAAIVALDRATKLYIQKSFSMLDTVTVIPNVFNIVHVENPGAAWGMLSDSPSSWRALILIWLSMAVTAAIGFMLWRKDPGHSPTMRAGLACVLGGALGNLWDRLFVGTVTDFLQFFIGSYEFPSFNVADISINVGVGLLLLDMWRHRKAAK